MKNSTRKLLAILATLAIALSVTVNQAPLLPDLTTPQTEVEEHYNNSDNKEPDCKPECEDDFDKDDINKY
ncbi:MAG: hypothetical protein LUH18_08445 [Oscillospiraceae bacterium]|nr:hypothetical protein [Oscillospiraceae bacterium]